MRASSSRVLSRTSLVSLTGTSVSSVGSESVSSSSYRVSASRSAAAPSPFPRWTLSTFALRRGASRPKVCLRRRGCDSSSEGFRCPLGWLGSQFAHEALESCPEERVLRPFDGASCACRVRDRALGRAKKSRTACGTTYHARSLSMGRTPSRSWACAAAPQSTSSDGESLRRACRVLIATVGAAPTTQARLTMARA